MAKHNVITPSCCHLLINWGLLLTAADDVNLTSDDIRTIERNADVLLNVCEDTGLAVNTGKTKYMEIGRHQGMIANEHIRIRVGSNFYGK